MEKEIIYFFGGLISLLLSVNAFFGRRTLEKISAVDLRLAVLIERHDSTDERSRQNSKEIERLRDRVHSLEGGQAQLLAYVEDNKNH